VFQNDSLTLSIGSNQSYAHKFGEKEAQLQLNVGIDYLMRDYKQKHALYFYSRTFDFSAGERLPLFAAGVTSLKAGIRLVVNADPGYNSRIPYLTATQAFAFTSNAIVLLSLGADFQTSKDKQNSLTTYKASTAGIIKNLLWKLDLRPLFAFSMIDTKLQKPSRGMETVLTPGIGLSRDLWKSWSADLDYSYTQRSSENKLLYAYSKHLVSLGVTYTF
jgi:opacity protein-like surface antigen